MLDYITKHPNDIAHKGRAKSRWNYFKMYYGNWPNRNRQPVARHVPL